MIYNALLFVTTMRWKLWTLELEEKKKKKIQEGKIVHIFTVLNYSKHTDKYLIILLEQSLNQ